MQYISTRNTTKTFSFKDVFLNGLAADGGLYVPKQIQSYSILLTSPAPDKLLTNFSNLECERLAFESNEVVLIPSCPH